MASRSQPRPSPDDIINKTRQVKDEQAKIDHLMSLIVTIDAVLNDDLTQQNRGKNFYQMLSHVRRDVNRIIERDTQTAHQGPSHRSSRAG